jgi:hypothetical protein
MAAFSFGLFEFFLTSLAFCIVTVAIARKFGRRETWLWWGIVVLVQLALVLTRKGAGLSSRAPVYLWALMWCVPAAAAVWVALRATSRAHPPGPIPHFGRTYGMFIAGGIVGLLSCLSLIR